MHTNVCTHVNTCIYECIRLGMYVARYIWVYMYICMHVCVHACVPSLLLWHYTYLMSLNKYGCYIANMSHIHNGTWAHRCNIFGHVCQKTTAISTSHVIAMYRPATNRPLNMPHIAISSCAHKTQLCQYKYFIWTLYSHQCDQEYWYTQLHL